MELDLGADEVVDLTRNSDTEEGEEEEDDSLVGTRLFMGRTFIEFDDENSVPVLTVKTFLRDCLQHPKILYHKDFAFFRTYLSELKNELFTLPNDSPFQQNHEDNILYVDRCDKKWLANLKKRIYSNYNDEFHWASISPVKRKSDLGLVIFKWNPGAFSINFLEAYIAFCRTFTEYFLDMANDEYDDVKGHDISKAHEYILEFLDFFKVDKNADVEVRYKEAVDAANERAANNKIEPSRTDLLYLFRRQPKGANSSSFANPKSSKPQKAQDSSSSSNEESFSDSDSSTCSSDSSSGGSEYKGYYTKEHRKRKKVKNSPTKIRRAVQISTNVPSKNVNNGMKMRNRTQTIRLNGATKKAYVPIDIRIVLERVTLPDPHTVSSTGEMDGVEIQSSGFPDVITLDTSDDEIVFLEEKKNTSTTVVHSTFNMSEGKEIEASEMPICEKPAATAQIQTIPNCSASPTPSSTSSIMSNSSTSTTPGSVRRKSKTSRRSSTVVVIKENKPVNTTTIIADKKSPQKKKATSTTFPCEICWFGKSFPSQKSLNLHMNNAHSENSRVLVACNYCGMKVKKHSLPFHQQICKKTITS